LKLGKLLVARDRRAWRSWLAKNHGKAKEIWLVYYRKSSGRPRIPYNAAVEEALCFGWIDSTVKHVDRERFAQRFSPRKPKSSLSQANRERVRMLIRQKRMTAAGLSALAGVFDPKSDNPGEFKVPPEILGPLKRNRLAWRNFQRLPAEYRRIRIAYIESRKRHGPEMFRRSLEHFIKMTERKKTFGMMK
jgi:uncharacterized protein YdeI (YjbR/CyaY-like superfamily)